MNREYPTVDLVLRTQGTLPTSAVGFRLEPQFLRQILHRADVVKCDAPPDLDRKRQNLRDWIAGAWSDVEGDDIDDWTLVEGEHSIYNEKTGGWDPPPDSQAVANYMVCRNVQPISNFHSPIASHPDFKVSVCLALRLGA
jgi:hypothetical protein